jgi:hypothetical protein
VRQMHELVWGEIKLGVIRIIMEHLDACLNVLRVGVMM